MFTFQTGVREVFSCYRCQSEYLHKEQGNLSDLQEKMHEADSAKGGKCMRSAVSARYERYEIYDTICSRLPENVAREIFDQSQTLKLQKNQ